MDIRIKSTDYELTPDVSAYIDERLAAVEKVLTEHDDAVVRCEVEVGRVAGHSKHGEVWFAEINISAGKGRRLRATAHSESVNGAIDIVKDEILRQVRRSKQIHQRLLRKGGAAIKWITRSNTSEK